VLRDSVYLALVAVGIVTDLPAIIVSRNPYALDAEMSVAQSTFAIAAAAWVILQLITMLFNAKRLAIHDCIAGSVVMRIDPRSRQPI
jgi:hypothetical protein